MVIEEAADLEVGLGKGDSLAARIRDTWEAYWRAVCRLELLTAGLRKVLRTVRLSIGINDEKVFCVEIQ